MFLVNVFGAQMMCLSALIITVVDKSLLDNSSLPPPPLSEVYLLLQKREK